MEICIANLNKVTKSTITKGTEIKEIKEIKKREIMIKKPQFNKPLNPLILLEKAFKAGFVTGALENEDNSIDSANKKNIDIFFTKWLVATGLKKN